MRNVTTKAGLTAGVAVAMLAAPLPALAAEDGETGDLVVTRFDDRYADGLFDPSKTAPSGDADRINSSSAAQLVDVNGTRWYISADEDGVYRFDDVPVGPATLYLSHPNNPAYEVFFDATGAESAADITRLPSTEYFGLQGTLQVTIDADGEERLVGMTALRLVADVQYADGTPAADVPVELGSGGQWYPATEYSFQDGTYEAFEGYGYVRHLPGPLGVRLQAPAGYRVASVTAGDNTEFDVAERDGAWWFDSAQVWNYFWNPAFTVTLEAVPDTTRPETTLVAPTASGPFPAIGVHVDATDDRGLQRIVANIYQNGKLVKSTQTQVGGATSGTHQATVSLPDGDYIVKYNAQDVAGNISTTRTFPVTIDATAPKATIKDGDRYTQGADGAYDLVSFKLYDAGKIDRVEINGKVKDLSNNPWSDVNFVKPGTFGAVEGENTLVVYDVAGNAQTVTFTLN